MASEVNSTDGRQDRQVLYQRARQMWLFGAQNNKKFNNNEIGDIQILEDVQEIYCSLWKTAKSADDPIARQAGEQLALMYLQSNKASNADRILSLLGYTCRLSTKVLDYDNETLSSNEGGDGSIMRLPKSPPCHVFDNFLAPRHVHILRQVFSTNDNTNYFTVHNYSADPPTPYTSYVFPYTTVSQQAPSDSRERQFLHHLVDQILHQIPEQILLGRRLRQQTRFVELWAHCRPPTSGHQLHFDSDNEGCGGVINNPIASAVLYLPLVDGDSSGGPSLVTTQRLTSSVLAQEGWLCEAVPGRLLVFPGNVLHGVIPGKYHNANARRITVMLAFWKDIRTRPGASAVSTELAEDEQAVYYGAAQAFPTSRHEWAKVLMQPCEVKVGNKNQSQARRVEPVAIAPVYEHVGGNEKEGGWTRQDGLPDYEQVFQGF